MSTLSPIASFDEDNDFLDAALGLLSAARWLELSSQAPEAKAEPAALSAREEIVLDALVGALRLRNSVVSMFSEMEASAPPLEATSLAGFEETSMQNIEDLFR
jgi:hypothetical protein